MDLESCKNDLSSFKFFSANQRKSLAAADIHYDEFLSSKPGFPDHKRFAEQFQKAKENIVCKLTNLEIEKKIYSNSFS